MILQSQLVLAEGKTRPEGVVLKMGLFDDIPHLPIVIDYTASAVSYSPREEDVPLMDMLYVAECGIIGSTASKMPELRSLALEEAYEDGKFVIHYLVRDNPTPRGSAGPKRRPQSIAAPR